MLIGLKSLITDPRTVSEDISRLAAGGLSLVRLTLAQLARDGAADDGTTTVAFAYRGVSYQIDLSARDAAAMDTALTPYLTAARRVEAGPVGARRPAHPAKPANGTPTAKDIRAWALGAGIPVSARGRVSADVVRQYHEARSS